MSLIFPVRTKDFIIGALGGAVTGLITAPLLPAVFCIIAVIAITELCFWVSSKYLI